MFDGKGVLSLKYRPPANFSKKEDGKMTERVGIVGIGLMGSALSGNLLQNGFEVQGYDLDGR